LELFWSELPWCVRGTQEKRLGGAEPGEEGFRIRQKTGRILGIRKFHVARQLWQAKIKSQEQPRKGREGDPHPFPHPHKK